MSSGKKQSTFDEKSPVQVTEDGEDAIDEKKLLRKLDWYLIPGLTVLYLLSSLDRSNGIPTFSSPSSAFSHCLSVGNARIEGLAADTHMSAFPSNVYGHHIPYHSLKRKPETSTSPH